MAWTHEFANGDVFKTEQEAREDVWEHISVEDVCGYMLDADLVDLVARFNSRSSDKEFCAWLSTIIEDAEARCCDDYVTYEDDDDGEDDS